VKNPRLNARKGAQKSYSSYLNTVHRIVGGWLLLAVSHVCAQNSMLSERPSEVGTLRSLILPTEAQSLVDYALATDGMLFIADKSTVWVKSPWGWDRVWSVSHNSEQVADIRCLAVVSAPEGDESLVIGTEEGAWTVQWQRRAPSSYPWSVFAYQYSKAERLEAIGGDSVSSMRVTSIIPIAGEDATFIRALALSDGGVSYTIVAQNGRLAFGAPLFGGETFQSMTCFSLRNGQTICQEYPDGGLRFISPFGTEYRHVELGPQLGGKAQVRAAVMDDSRSIVFLGTERGLLVGTVDETGSLAGDLVNVPALRGFDVRYLGFCAGRLLVAGNPGSGAPKNDAIWWELRLGSAESTVSLAELAQSIKFEPASGGNYPQGIADVLAVAEDAIWVKTEDEAVFEWTPKQWRRLRAAEHGGLDTVSFWRTKQRQNAPLVIPDPTHNRLTSLITRDPRRFTRH
jgi:hypothetical protein